MKSLRRQEIALPLVLLVIAVLPTAVAAQVRRPITETDLFKFVWAADPQMSPRA